MDTIFPIMMSIYEQLRLLRQLSRSIIEGCYFDFYQMHNAKLIYLLTHHAQWSKNKKAFLLCNCDKGDGVQNEEYTCTIDSDDKQIILYNKSEINGWRKQIQNIQ